jgi:RHS repeat-associated protein
VVRVVRYYHLDHLGSPTHGTDATGELVSHTRFHPYGVNASQFGGQPIYGFTGAEIDRETDLGLIRMGARWYAPRLGRWTGADPLFLQEPKKGMESVLESSLYGYVRNRPTVLTDATGMSAEEKKPTEPPAWTGSPTPEKEAIIANGRKQVEVELKHEYREQRRIAKYMAEKGQNGFARSVGRARLKSIDGQIQTRLKDYDRVVGKIGSNWKKFTKLLAKSTPDRQTFEKNLETKNDPAALYQRMRGELNGKLAKTVMANGCDAPYQRLPRVTKWLWSQNDLEVLGDSDP